MRTKDTNLLNSIKEFVEQFCNDNGRGPTVRDVMAECNIAIGTAHKYLTALTEEGVLTVGASNRYESVGFEYDQATANIELVGSISCGPLSEAQQENRGYIRLPRSFVGAGEFFFLEAKGDSMINAGIEEGDLILVKKQQEAEAGQIVVALVENENTLKRLEFDRRRRRYYLHPENEKYSDMYVDRLEIQGVVSKIIKDPK